MRLVDGQNEREGRVEVCIENQWGSICDSDWTTSDAAVICTQLGHHHSGESCILCCCIMQSLICAMQP